MNTRSKIIATVAVLWIAALGVVAFQTLSTADTKRVNASPTIAQQRQIDDCVQTSSERRRESRERRPTRPPTPSSCAREILPPPTSETDYDVAGAFVRAAAASLIALVVIGATIIWTSPKNDEHVATTTPSSPPAPQPKSTHAPAVETAAPTATDPAGALRRLKALHADGILTDDEYETKRQGLADRL